MSYVVTIKRTRPITLTDWREAIAKDSTLAVTCDDGQRIGTVWRPPDKSAELMMCCENGEVWGTPGTDAALAKMQSLAKRLDGQLVGENGEDLT